MTINKTISYYLLIAAPGLLVLAATGNKANMIWGYILGMITSVIQIILIFLKSNSIINHYKGVKRKNKIVFTPILWFGMIIAVIAYYISVRFWGVLALLACFIATGIQKPTFYIISKKEGGC